MFSYDIHHQTYNNCFPNLHNNQNHNLAKLLFDLKHKLHCYMYNHHVLLNFHHNNQCYYHCNHKLLWSLLGRHNQHIFLHHALLNLHNNNHCLRNYNHHLFGILYILDHLQKLLVLHIHYFHNHIFISSWF